jgi:hypothetical protein
VLVASPPTQQSFTYTPLRADNFDTNGGLVGDQFMMNIEQVAARVPYMVSHGNHEDSAPNLAHYIERFRAMPSNAVPEKFTTLAGSTTNTLYVGRTQTNKQTNKHSPRPRSLSCSHPRDI